MCLRWRWRSPGPDCGLADPQDGKTRTKDHTKTVRSVAFTQNLKNGVFTYDSDFYSILVCIREVTEQLKGVVFCKSSGVRKIPQLKANALHRRPLKTQDKRQNKSGRKAAGKRRRELTAGTFCLLKTSVIRPQLLSKWLPFGWHFVAG